VVQELRPLRPKRSAARASTLSGRSTAHRSRRAVPSRLSSVNTYEAPPDRRAALANPHHARRSQECGSSAALPLAACAARARYHIAKCRWHRCFSGPPTAAMMQRRTVSALRRSRIISPMRCVTSVDSVRPRGLYRRFTVRGSPRCYCAPAKLLTDTRFLRGPGVRFRSDRRNFDLSDFRRAGPTGPGLFDK
jgi:hypothetical protein